MVVNLPIAEGPDRIDFVSSQMGRGEGLLSSGVVERVATTKDGDETWTIG